MDNYLVSENNLDGFEVQPPVKKGKYFISKVKNNGKPVVIQFPRMTISKGWDKSTENLELTWSNMNSYAKEVYDWCQNLNDVVVNKVSEGSTSWFGKEIPLEHVEEMYKNFVRTPKKSDSGMWMKVVPYLKDGNLHTTFFDKRGKEVDCQEFRTGWFAVPILKLKYLIFTKDTCQVIWELQTTKIYRPKKPSLGYSFKEGLGRQGGDGNDSEDDGDFLETESLAPQDEFPLEEGL